jgi:hypothetical protein
MNAKVGKDPMSQPTIGTNSLHETHNDNGERMIDFATSHGMSIGSTMFIHKDIHKMTWRSPDGRKLNQIDHIMIDGRHISNLIDVRTYKGANCDSEHFLVTAKVRARISKSKMHPT